MIINGKIPNAGCEKCEKGYIKIPKKDFGMNYDICGCLVERENLVEAKRLYSKSGLPNLKRHFRFEDWDQPKSINFDFLDSFASGESKVRWLYIHGGSGTGKTYLAIVIAGISLLKEKKTYFTGVTELLDNLRPDNENKAFILSKCKEADLLILDDIGQEKSSQWVAERLYLIINHRWTNDLPTIFTSNFNSERLKTFVSEAVYSRVKGFSFEIPLKSKDRRLQ
jgi:DNA replication protein DnaC